MDFYNEIDPYAADWLENLILAGHLPEGKVDRRSIREINPSGLYPFTQCHFFAGIAGWPLAFRMAGWPATRPVWSGSCPCQPYSAAGKQEGNLDERDLWPDFFRLIREQRPPTVFGEQVANAVGFGWIDRVQADLAAEGYTVRFVVLGAHSVGAPHIRQRLYWVAYSEHAIGRPELQEDGNAYRGNGFGRGGGISGLEYSNKPRGVRPEDSRSVEESLCGEFSIGSGLGDSELSDEARFGSIGIPLESEQEAERSGIATPWSDFELIGCADGKTRRFKPGIFPLAHGVPARVGKLRAAGNAIVPQVAAEFIKAFMEIRNAEK